MTQPQPMEITSKQMARVYNAIDLKSVHSVMDEIRDIYTATSPQTPAAPAPEPVKFPNSTELLLMAHTDWKNRIERKHTHDEIPWTDGWIHGYLTPKPDWKRKEQHDAATRKDEHEQVLEWAKKHHWPTTGGHRVIGFDKLKEFLESLRGGA